MKPNKFFQKTFFALGLIFAFGVAIIEGCKKEDLQSPSHLESTTISSATGDSIPPTVTFTFPKNKDTVFDSITIRVTATDNVGVASVQLKVDNVSIGTKTAAPYNFGWNTKKVMNGSHLLSAKAVDASGNPKTVNITVNTLNAGIVSPEQQLITLINNERTARGISKVLLNTKLLNAAREHSTDMAKNNFLAHGGSDGSTLDTRLTKYGYPWTFAGEDLAAGLATAQAVFNAWHADGAKLAILIDARFRDIGVGCAHTSAKTATFNEYWTLNIATTQ